MTDRKITRIVRMEFRQEAVEDFLAMFSSTSPMIRNFPGCCALELHRDEELSHVYYTYSTWNSKEDLQTYRQSDLFRETWSLTKSWFGGPPQAYSLVLHSRINS